MATAFSSTSEALVLWSTLIRGKVLTIKSRHAPGPSKLANLKVVEADHLEWEKSKGFMIVVFTFVLTLFANMKSIQHAPVDTFICLRSTSPVGPDSKVCYPAPV